MADSMSSLEQLKELETRFNDLTLRERALGFLVLLALVYMIFSLLWLDPITRVTAKVQTTIDSLEQQVGDKTQQIAMATQQISGIGNKEKEQKIAQLQIELEKANQILQEMTAGLIDPDHLAKILEEVLMSADKLTLVKMKTLPSVKVDLGLTFEPVDSSFDESQPIVSDVPEDVQRDVEQADSAEPPLLEHGIHKHTVELTVKGSFKVLHQYLQALEGLDWSFYWEELNYEVEKYPDSIIVLKVYTLTSEEGWIDV